MKRYRRLPWYAFAAAVGIAPAAATAQTLEPARQVIPQIVGEAPAQTASWGKQQPDAEGRYVYLVRLDEPTLATYDGGLPGLRGTSRNATGAELDIRSPASQAYLGHLRERQAKVLAAIDARLGRAPAMARRYEVVYHGFAVRLTPAEAAAIAKIPGIARVEQDRVYFPETDSGPAWIGAPGIWTGTDTGTLGASRGAGIVIGILDTGINSDHPSFADIGGDGYDHVNPLGAGNYVAGSHCDANPAFCNDKLIGAWDLVSDPSDPGSPEDSDGHGSHTGSTSGGNAVTASVAAPTTSLIVDASGVAPHANLIAYDVCVATCPGAALLAGIDQVVLDDAALPNGIGVINYSISGGEAPWSDGVSQGFLSAVDAGIVVAASAGNSGPGAGTVAHEEPWTMTVAASTHDRIIVNRLVDMASDGAALGDITGAGITSGYGPAPIVYAQDFPTSNGSANDTQPEQCLNPFPPGHFSGEIVVCDRGTIARTAKGDNVLAGGAGGLVLANLPTHGDGVNPDPHSLPAAHIGTSAADALRAWIGANTNTVARIAGYAVEPSAAAGDVMASFSSRGPAAAADVIKPDITAPGVSIIAALENGAQPPPEYGFLSGTSMSSPHAAGSAALLRALTGWSPAQVKSALMSTALRDGLVKEDGVTPSDPFDRGAGRVDLTRAARAGLTWDETASNFQAADPATGGDPRTLNLASLMDSACGASCQWTRTVTNVQGSAETWTATGVSDTIGLSVSPGSFSLAPGAAQVLTITAMPEIDTLWQFGEIRLTPDSAGAPEQHMPVAVQIEFASNPALFTKTVDKTQAALGETLHYTISVAGTPLAASLSVSDTLSPNASIVPGSEQATITNGTTTTPFSCTANDCSWSGTLDAALALAPSASPFGYVSLAGQGIPPIGCPTNCDDGAFIFTGLPPMQYNGATYTEIILSVNGAIEMGSASGIAAPATNVALPDPALPNNLLAPLWTDLDLSAGGQWYLAVLNDGPDQYVVAEWEDVPRFGSTDAFTFQLWIEAGTANVWYVYERLDNTAIATVALEDDTGSAGDTYYHNGAGTAPVVGADLGLSTSSAGTAILEFDATVDADDAGAVFNEATLMPGGGGGWTETARAITEVLPDTDGDGIADVNDNCTLIINPSQCDSDGDNYGNHCDADFNNNDIVNSFDLNTMRGRFGNMMPAPFDIADLNCNGVVNSFDLGAMRDLFGAAPGPSGLVPP